jgi:hypothetical protein
MSEADEFYRRRDQRSTEYGAGLPLTVPPVHIIVDPTAARSASGQVLLLSLLNQLGRGFRRITVDVPESPLVIQALVPASDVRSAAVAMMAEIDPFGEFGPAKRPPAGSLIVGIGTELRAAAHWHLGASGAVGHLADGPVSVQATPADRLGAAVASCLGAAAVWRAALGLPVRPLAFSLDTLAEGLDGADRADLPPTELGHVLLIGAGAVANGLAYWAPLLGVSGDWDILDGDVAMLHNTNRGLCLLPAHTEWGGRTPMPKAEVLAAHLPGAHAIPHWYHEAQGLDPTRYDVVLPLANDYDVRQLVANTGHPTVLHATTGRSWNALLHRHLAGTDDCIACRMRGQPVGHSLRCSTAPILNPTGESRDAALPFLSAAAGLLLTRALMRLGDGSLRDGAANRWSWFFDFGGRVAQRATHSCADCGTALPRAVRTRLYGNTRWVSQR